jgi:uncharacterized protein (TIGR03067 family)
METVQVMDRSFLKAASLFAIIASFATLTFAQSDAVDSELKRLSGNWRVIELVENGRAVPEDQMRQLLPGGGTLEIVDYTVLFQSPLDGSKSTKSFRLDPTSYPKRIAILDRDSTHGTGIYEFDQGKLVICITPMISNYPTEFSAVEGSQRTLMVLQRFEPGTDTIPGRNGLVPQLPPVQSPYQSPAVAQDQATSVPVATGKIALPSPPSDASNAALRVLSDSEVRNMAVGTWRLNDAEGSVDIVFNANGVFRTFRYSKVMQNFQTIFVPTPISSGTWSISSGRLIAQVTQSSRMDKVNQTFVPAVRSISAVDMVLEDHLGTVSRAVKIP